MDPTMSMGGPPGGPMGPGGVPSDNPGDQAQSMTMVRQAVDMLQNALQGLPLGSDPHKEVLKAITSLSKTVPPSAEIPGVQTAQLAKLQQQAQGDQMLRQLAAQMGQGPAVAPVTPAVQ